MASSQNKMRKWAWDAIEMKYGKVEYEEAEKIFDDNRNISEITITDTDVKVSFDNYGSERHRNSKGEWVKA